MGSLGTVPAIEVIENTTERRFEGYLSGTLVGYSDYEIVGDVIVFPHSYTLPEFRGHGIGAAVVQGAMDAVAAVGGLRVHPTCPFVRDWLDAHPAYSHLTRPPA